MEKFERNFKGIWVPKELWLDDELSIMEKVFLAEIDSLDNEKGCFASNKYFSDFFKITKGRCSQIITALEKKNKIVTEYKRDGKEITERTIRVVNKLTRYLENDDLGSKYIKQGYLENDKENNTSNNNISNIYKEKYFDNEEINILFIEYLSIRKFKKYIMTDRAITLLLNKLQDKDAEEQKQMIENAILGGWKSFYESKNKNKGENKYEYL